MANYKAVTADEVYMRGGLQGSETGMNRKKVVTYSEVGGPWFSQHGCTFYKTSSLDYSANMALSITDLKINGQQQEDEPVVVHKIPLDISYMGKGYSIPETAVYLHQVTEFLYRENGQSPRWINNCYVGDSDYQVKIFGFYPTGSSQWGSINPREQQLDCNVYLMELDFDELPRSNVRGMKFAFVLGEDYDSINWYLENNQSYPDSSATMYFKIGWPGGVPTTKSNEYDTVIYYEIEWPVINDIDVYMSMDGFCIQFPSSTQPLTYYDSAAVVMEDERNTFVIVLNNFSI